MCCETCGRCDYTIGQQLLACGHQANVLCSKQTPICNEINQEITLTCGHKLSLRCAESRKQLFCCQHCGVLLDCGHTCQGLCGGCQAGAHPPCSGVCGKGLSCGHACRSTCHQGGLECPPCNQLCLESCAHGPCQNLCNWTCDPFVKAHKRTCIHQQATELFCSLPSDIVPCIEPCKTVLSCGHLCPAICGESCPTATECPACIDETFSSITTVIIPECRHLVSVQELDHDLSAIYDIDSSRNLTALRSNILDVPAVPRCHCGAFVTGINRYAIIDRFRCTINTFDGLLAKLGRKFNQVAQQILERESFLEDTFGIFCHNIRPNCQAGNANKQALSARGTGLVSAQKDIVNFRGK